ncbi:MAG: fatty acyl-AMP ligase, partial [bacterium]|nr:fatty acyl-AMP ligase [bacterium]
MHKQRGATIPARLLDNLEHAADACALRLLHDNAETQTLTYRQLIDEAARWARWYEDLGLLHGDRVVIILQHSVDLYAAFVGGLLRGVVPSMFAFPSPKYSSEEYFRTIGVLVENADPRLLVTYPELAEQLTAGASLPAATRVCTPRDLPTGTSKFPVGPNVDPESTAFLQYSSGTTGIKKSVAISHRALLWQIDRYADAIRLASDDVIVSWLPLYHDMGLIACLFLPLLKRVPLVAMSPFEWVRRPGMWLRAVSDFGGTLSWLPNFAYSFMPKNVTDAELADLRLSSLRGVVNCSEPVMAASHAQLLERLAPYGLRPEALGTCYAMAENTFAVTSGGFDSPVASDRIDASEFVRSGCAIPTADSTPQGKTLVSSGQALPDTEIAIVSPQGTPLAERRVGEIVLRSPCLLNEYYRNPDATAAGLHGDRYFTGDLGYLADGELYVTGRLKDLIIIAGQNVHPQDIEALLNDVPGLIPGRNVALGVSDSTNGTEKLVILAETHATEPAER